MRSLSVTTIRRMSSPADRRMAIDPADVVRGDPDPTRTPDDVTELLAGKTDGRRVDDREEFLEVLDEEPVEQGLVAVLEGGQSDVPLELIGLAPDVLQFEGKLFVDRRHTRWQETMQAEGVALAGRKCRALVEASIRDQLVPAALGGTAIRVVIDGRGRVDPVIDGEEPVDPLVVHGQGASRPAGLSAGS